jgi:hypothetical protein
MDFIRATRPQAACALLMLLVAGPHAALAQFGLGTNYGSGYTSYGSRPSTSGIFGLPTGYPSSGATQQRPLSTSNSGYRPNAGSSLPTMPVRYGATTGGSSSWSPNGPSFASGNGYGYRRRPSNLMPFAMGAFAGALRRACAARRAVGGAARRACGREAGRRPERGAGVSQHAWTCAGAAWGRGCAMP